MALNFTQISGTFAGGDDTPLSGTVTFQPSQTVYSTGIPLVSADTPVRAQITGGHLQSMSGGTVELLATDNAGLSLPYGGSAFWFWSVEVTIAGQVQPSWNFLLPYSPSPVDLYALAEQQLAMFPNPMDLAGDVIVGGTGGSPERLPGNASAARQFLISQGTGTAAQAPAWGALQAGDIPSLPYDAAGAAAAAQAASTPVLTQTAVQTANYTAPANHLVPVSTASGNVTVTLPNAPAAGTVMGVKMVTLGGSNTVTIACAGSDVFNKAGSGAALTLSLLNQGVLLEYQSGIWLVLSDDLPLSQLTALFDAAGAAAAAAAASVPLSQSFALANNAYQSLQAWTVTGQTDSPLPAFGLVAGSQTYGTSPAIQGPAFWFGYNPALGSASISSSAHGAAGLSCFADAGDSNNGAGGHGVEFNPAFFRTPNGVLSTNAISMVAIDDNTNTVSTTIRCGTGNVNGRFSAISLQNSDASKTYMAMGALTSDVVTVYQPLALTASYVGNPVAFAISNSGISGNTIVTMSCVSGANNELLFKTGANNRWGILHEDTGSYLIIDNLINGVPHVYFIAGASYAAASTWFLSKVTAYSSLIVGSAALATTATDGFLYLPSCAGPPTGTPTTQTGTVPFVFDSVDNRLYFYTGGAWEQIAG